MILLEGLCRLVYVSRNAMTGPVAAMEEEVARVLEVSRRNNARDGVTGALLFSEDCFAQMLEGPSRAVRQVFERIQLDPRHRETVVLDYAPAERREFSDWSMAYAGRLPTAQVRYAALVGEPARVTASGEVTALLRDVVRRSAVS